MTMKNIFADDGFIYPYVWWNFYEQTMRRPKPCMETNEYSVQKFREYFEKNNSEMDITKIRLKRVIKGEEVLVDAYICQLLEAFNKKGFPTSFSCSGHLDDCFEGFYIRFKCSDLTDEKRKALKDLCTKCNVLFEHYIHIVLPESRDFNECGFELTKHDTGLFKSIKSYESNTDLYRYYAEICKKEWWDNENKKRVCNILPKLFLYQVQVDEYNDIRFPTRTTKEYTELSENELKEKFRYMVETITRLILNVNLLD